MKLFSEKLTKYKFIILSVFTLVEISSFTLLLVQYKSPYLKVFDDSKTVTINKTIAITHTLNEIIKLSLHRYSQDLKLAGKHMLFLLNDGINNKSQYYQNMISDNDKKIYYATLEELKDKFPYYFKEDARSFFYLDKYIHDYFENKTKAQYILDELMNKTIHPELNSISYYKTNGNIDNVNNVSAKYLISILKTNFVKRIAMRGRDLEILNYFLLINDEMYLYPPEAYNNSLIYLLKDTYKCNNNFPSCAYNQIINNIKSVHKERNISDNDYIFPISTNLKLDYEKVLNSLCLRIPFGKKFIISNYSYAPLLCMEINYTKVFENIYFQEKEAITFIFFSNDTTFIPIYTNKNGVYEDIKKIFNDTKFGNYSLNVLKRFSFFHFLYLDLFKDSSLLKKNEIKMEDILYEFDITTKKIFEGINSFRNTKNDYFTLEIEKTGCKSDIYYNSKKCGKDSVLLIIYPLRIDFNGINSDYIDDPNVTLNQTLFYSMAFIDNNYKYMKWKINQIVVIIIIKLFFFYFISSMCLIFLYFIFVQIFYEKEYSPINELLYIIKGGSFFDLKDKNEILQKKQKMKIEPNNKEMHEIKNLFDYLVKTMLLKINFEQNGNNMSKKESKEKNKKGQLNNISNHNIKANNALMSKNNIDTLNEYMDLINNINNAEIKIMFAFIISYGHFRKGFYKLSENEFKNLIIDMNLYQNKLSNKNENNDSKLKDSISRCSKISYLNEYSLTNELSETTLPIIKVKLLAQKIYYLYALSIYNQEKIKANGDKKYNKDNTKKRYEEAIKYFIECKNISILLGTDIIRQIFSLIMISKCYIELKNYKESMININEALLLYSDLQKAFKDKPYFNPKMMMFTENYIFQSIMLTMAQTTYTFNKYPQTCWILMKMIETSPFIFNMIHYQTCFLLNNCLTQIESMNNLPFRQTDKYKKKISKMFARINVRLANKEKNLNKDSRSNNNTNNMVSIPSATNTQVNNISISYENMNQSNLKKMNRNKEMYTNKYSISVSSLNHFSRNRYKNITLCISEKLLQEINGDELKDVIIKFFKKCFYNGIEEDKFGFIQFSCNGKKTISIKSDSIETFLQKLELNKLAFKINDSLTQNNNEIQFMEFSNLFLSIIKSHKQLNYEDRGDNIIIIFINTSDIRFNGQKECVDTINELNNNNYSVILFTYDNEIEPEKIEGIYSFVYGLNDGHFFKAKNYQQIKQVFMNFCVKDSQEKFNNYNYEITDFML